MLYEAVIGNSPAIVSTNHIVAFTDMAYLIVNVFHLVGLMQLVIQLLKPNAPIIKTTIGRVSPGTGVQLNCSITKVI